MTESTAHLSDILPVLVRLCADLYSETAGFSEQTADAQLWYNRGYANGLAAALRECGHGDALSSIGALDPPDVVSPHALLPWGKAYRHGFEMGHRETLDVIG